MAKHPGKPQTAKSVPGTVSVLPVQLRPGDTFIDDAGTLREQWWQAYERVTVRRAATA